MATNRGAYDHRQFLHYPDKDPFSDGAQRRLDNLIKDFLHTGIAFANGASVQDIGLEEREESAGLSPQALNGVIEQEQYSLDDAERSGSAEDENEEYEGEVFRVDKGKRRDAREGPGLQGLWARTDRLESGTPPQGDSVDDAISLSNGSDSGVAVLNDGEAEDGEGSYEEGYEEGEAFEEDGQEYESVRGEASDLESTHSREASSEQEVIYIGDSDEEDALPNTEPEGGPETESQGFHADREEPSPDWASAYDEEEEREGQGVAWDFDHEGNEEHDGQEQEWHHTQGKESDEDERDFLAEDMEQEDDNLPQMSQAGLIPAARRFLTSAPLLDPWSDAGSTGSASLTAADWGPQSRWMHEHDEGHAEDDEDADAEDGSDLPPIPLRSFEPALDYEGHEPDQDDTEANELDPPPEPEQGHFSESLDPALSALGADAGGTSYPPLPIPDIVASEPDIERKEALQSAEFGESVVPGQNAVGISELDEANQAFAFASSMPSTELPLSVELSVPEPVTPLEALSSLQDSASCPIAADNTSSFSAPLTYPNLSPSLTSSDDMFGNPPFEFPSANLLVPHDASEVQESISLVDNGSSSHDEPTTEEGLAHDHLLYMDDMLPSGSPTNPTFHHAISPSPSSEPKGQNGYIEGVPEGSLKLDQDATEFRHSPLLAQSTQVNPTDLFSQRTNEVQKIPAAEVLDPHTFSTDEEEQDPEDYRFKPIALHPAVFDHDNERADSRTRSPSPLRAATADRITPGIECHSAASEDLGGHVQTYDQPIVTEVVSEYGEEAREPGDRGEDDEAEELPAHHSDDVTFMDYVVYEASSSDGRDRIPVPETDRQVREASAGAADPLVPSGFVPANSVGSSTPPLSPTATVTNASSAADPSIATSDVSTVNQASVSVVTASSPPPPIHVSRPSPTPVNIHQPPVSHVGFPFDEGQDSGEEQNVLPDPRLPPEPTHLRIPVGVVGRSLRENKEERAESVWVEPPTPHLRSETGDGSSNGESGGVHTEKTPLSPVVQEVPRECTPDLPKSGEPLVSVEETLAHPVDHNTTDGVDGDVPAEHEPEDGDTNELAYPESESDHTGKEDRSDQGPGKSDKDSDPSPSPPSGVKPSFDDLSFVVVDGLSTAIVDGEVSRESSHDGVEQIAEREPPSKVNEHRNDTNGHTVASVEKRSGKKAKENSLPLPLDGSLRSPEPEDPSVSLTPTVSDSGSPTKSEYNLRRSTKGKGKAKATRSLDARSESPPPQLTIRVQGKGSQISRKRSRGSDTSFSPSKQPRLTRSAAAKTKSTLSMGDMISTSLVPDDKSDVSSVASSSSVVSRILRQRGSGSSSLASIPSRSPSVVSQSSPTNERSSSAMPPPIRPYIPHNHSHNRVPAPPVKDITHRRTASVPRASPSVSPGPSSPAHSTSTHSSSTHSTSTHSATHPTSIHQTRASCTDHKISLPGPKGLLYFLVPRCSLLDPEVEKDDSIVDCGAATKEEVKRAVGDIEAVGLDSNVLGVVRQLAGVQLMREGQVGYLPKPGERIRSRAKHRRSHVPPLSHAQDVAPQVDPSGPSGAGSSHLAPLSLESAPSPSSSSQSSFSGVSETPGASDQIRSGSKVFKADHGTYEPAPEEDEEDESDNDGTTVIAPPSSPTSSRSPKPSKARKRKLRREDAAYQPENDATESSSDVEVLGAKKKGKTGTKRRRSEASALGENGSAGAKDAEKTPPKKKRKRKDLEMASNQDESLDGHSEHRRKKAKRKTAPKRGNADTEDNLKMPI